MHVDARLLPVGTLAAALAGATLVVVLVGGPLWLVVPGALGAALPAVITRARRRPVAGLRTVSPVDPAGRLPADPS